MKILDYVALVLVVVGGLNWGLFAFGYNLVEMILGVGVLAQAVYVLVALSALYMLYSALTKKSQSVSAM